MQIYKDYLQYILDNGIKKEDRTGTGTISIFGYQMRFNLQKGFPILTTKKIHFKSVAYELLWFLTGNTNIKFLKENKVSIWDEWADENGNLGPIYGKQWRFWENKEGKIIDQISQIIDQIKNNPNSRRILVSAWNPGEIDKMALPPCHYAFQFYIADNKLSCMFQMRSVDSFLGLPFNIASYSLLTHLIADQCDLELGDLIFTGGDCHIYLNHLEQVKTLLSREPLPLPKLQINRKAKDIFSYNYEDFELVNYKHHGIIKAPVSV
jgi:thymidylate synthase